MATDYAEKEREFVAALAEDTGRDLSAWMDAISSAGLAHRNDIIDWLRQNGFTFANASWLERIHHNGGRLVYGDDLPPPERAPARAHKVASPIATQALPAKPPEPAIGQASVIASSHLTAHAQPVAGSARAPDIDTAAADVLLAAKGLRPLAMLALQEIYRTIPQTRLDAQGPLILLLAPEPYLALLPGAKALRFYGDFDRTGDSRVMRAEAAMKTSNKAAPPFPSVLVLTDARLVDAAFAALVKSAHTRAHG